MFRYVGGDFPEDIVLDENKIKWDVHYTNEIELSQCLAKVEVLPEKEEGVVSVVCYLHDGRHFMVDMDQESYEKLMKIQGKKAVKKGISKKKMTVLCVVVSVTASLIATCIARYSQQQKAKKYYFAKWKGLR